jgi:thiamine-monophosphate kinase
MQKHHTYLIGGDSVVVNSSAYHCDVGGNLGCGKDNATGNGNAIGISKGSDTASGTSNSDGDGGGDKVKATSETNRADGFIVPITFSFTLIGYVDKGKELLTSQAKIGDDIYVTGTLGNAYAGYQILQGKITDNLFTKTEREYLINYFKAPSAPFANFAFAQKLYQYVDCATDISDGLASEVKILSKASNIPQENFKININQAPISKAVRKLTEHNANVGGNATKQSEASKQIKAREAKQRAINFGDDYEILFTSSPLNQRKLQEIATKENITITKIGCIM